MKPKLYGYWRSSCSWRVRIAVHHKQIDYDYHPIHLVREGGEQHAGWYAALNPMRTVPLWEWEEDGVVRRVSQSVAILELLEERHPQRPLLPEGAADRATTRMLVEMINSGIQPLQNLAVLREVKGKLHADEKAWARQWIERGLDAVEAALGHTAGAFCIANTPTLADACLVPQLYNARRFGVDLTRFPTAVRIDTACAALPAFAAAHPDRQPDAEVG